MHFPPVSVLVLALKWILFVDWCSTERTPGDAGRGFVLSFLQEGLEQRLSPSTLKVYVATVATHHDAVDGKSSQVRSPLFI